MDFIDQMILEAQHGKQLPKLERENPSALVLCTIFTECEHCHRTFRHPNPHLLLRYGTTLKWLGTETAIYTDLPRERITMKQKAAACEHCFGEAAYLANYNFGGEFK